HASNSRGLMVLRAERAGPEETEVDSGQVTSEIRDKFAVPSAGSATIPFTRRDEVSPFAYG
ncbi:hypothetical protein TYRP_023708, partial [Tyrophagus putrescentiae]